uniref:ribonuclease H n=1 Tax=Pelodiscus sinensis TaxID=13735 RepID=K7F0G6_PELSI
MPFGLNRAAATFQQLMDHLLKEHHEYAAAYIDDVVIYSVSWKDHLGHVRAILKTLEGARLTVNPGKCAFGQNEVAYLGYVVGNGRLKPQIDKVKAVRDHPAPTTKRQVRQFLGLAGYYRRFIPRFATIAAPLTDLTKGGPTQKVRWTPQYEEAFQWLKKALTWTPVLAQLDFTKPFLVQTDASNVGHSH